MKKSISPQAECIAELVSKVSKGDVADLLKAIKGHGGEYEVKGDFIFVRRRPRRGEFKTIVCTIIPGLPPNLLVSEVMTALFGLRWSRRVTQWYWEVKRILEEQEEPDDGKEKEPSSKAHWANIIQVFAGTVLGLAFIVWLWGLLANVVGR